MDHQRLPFIRTTAGLVVLGVVALGVGFFAGMEYKAYQVRSALEQALTAATTGTTAATTAQPDAVAAATGTYIDKGIGDEVALQTLEFKVLSVKEEQTIQSSLGSSATADAGAKFVVVSLSITNLTNGNLLFPSGGIPLVDSQGRQYTDYSGTIGNIDNYLDGTTLPPGIAQNGVEVYEVPSTDTSYFLEAAKAGTNDIYRVKLQ